MHNNTAYNHMSFKVNGIERIERFKYLCNVIGSDERSEKEIKSKIVREIPTEEKIIKI